MPENSAPMVIASHGQQDNYATKTLPMTGSQRELTPEEENGMFGWLTGRRKREEQFMLDMMRVAAEGHHQHRLRQAIATISTTKLDQKNATENAAIAAATLATAVAQKAIGEVDDDDDRFVAGLFALVYTNYFTWVVAGDFVVAAPIAVLHTLKSGHFEKWFNPVMDFYNQASASQSQEVLAIGQSCEKWYKEPTKENFDRLVELFALCREHVREP